MGVRNKRYPTQAAASAEYQSRKRADARLEQEAAETRQERENTEATEAMDRQRREERVADLPSIPRREQDGDGYRQEGHGHGDHVDGQDGGKFTVGDAAGLAGMAALALFAPGVGAVADAGLAATTEAGVAADASYDTWASAVEDRLGLGADASAEDVSAAEAREDAAKEELDAADAKKESELAARRKLLKYPSKVRSLDPLWRHRPRRPLYHVVPGLWRYPLQQADTTTNRRVVQARGQRPRTIVATTLAESQRRGAQTQPSLL